MFHIAAGIILAFLILAAVRKVAENIQDINYNRRIKALLRKQQGAQQDGGGDMSTSSWLILTFVCAALLLVMVVESTRLPGKVTAPDFSGVSDAQVMAILRQAGTQAPSAAPPAAAKEVDDWVTAPQQSQVGADFSAAAQWLQGGVGAVIAGAGRIAQAGTGPSAQRVLTAFDLVDEGKNRDAYQKLTDSERQQVSAYRGGSPDDKAAQRAALQQTMTDYQTPNAVTNAGMAVERAAPAMFPVAPEREGIQTGVARMIGGVVPALAAGAPGGPAGMLASFAAIGAQAYDGAWQAAVAKGASQEEAEDVAGKSAVAQAATMVAPIGRLIITRVPMPLRDGLQKTLINLGQNGVEFGSANALGTFMNNYVAQQTYDPGRSLTQGTGDAMLEGTIAGLIVPAVAGVARAGVARAGAAGATGVEPVMQAPDVDTAIAAATQAAQAPDAAQPPVPMSWGDLFRPKPVAAGASGEAVPQAGGATAVASEFTTAIRNHDFAGAYNAAKKLASAQYQAADQAGGVLSPDFTNRFIDQAEALAPQTTEGKTVLGQSAVTGLVERIQNLRDQPITLQGAQEIDEGLGKLISKEYGQTGLSGEGKDLLDLQTTFRNMIKNAGPDDVEGGMAGFNALSQARGIWSQAMKMGDLERIMDRASRSDNPATEIKSGINTLLSKRARSAGYTDTEKAALQQAAQRGVLGGTAHVFGSHLIPYISGAMGEVAGGPLGAVVAGGAGHLGSMLSRNAATAIQRNRAGKALGVLGQGVPQPPPAP